jgi:diaminopimelate decarboxylase
VGESLLIVDAATLEGIAGGVGTPVYVYSADEIRERFTELDSALAGNPHRICYSVKANSNRAILELLRGLGAGADIVSGGEMQRALVAGFAPASLVFSGVGKTRDELDAAISADVGLINVESGAELRVLDEVAKAQGKVARFGIRVNPDVVTETHPYTQTGERGMKFGVPFGEVVSLARWAQKRDSISLHSLGMHIGSQIPNAKHYVDGTRKLANLVAELRQAKLGDLHSLDVGGGLGITYTNERALSASDFSSAVTPLARQTGLELVAEPGRFIVGNAGVLLCRCLYRKKSGGRTFVVVDAAMNDLIRPCLYDAVHDIRVVSHGVADPSETVGCDVVGPICETGDFLGIDRELNGVGAGSLIAILGAGAYAFSMSSTYNSRPRAAEVLVDGDRWAVVRQRETVQDLTRGEISLDGTAIEWR